MGTNFYARIIPTEKRKEQIKKAIDNNLYDDIDKLINDTYGSPHYNYESNSYIGGNIHLGKQSKGWKFLWNPNWYKLIDGHFETTKHDNGTTSSHFIIDESYNVFKYYNLTKNGIKEFINRDDIEIYDEYGEKKDKDIFWRNVLEWGEEDGWDYETYCYECDHQRPLDHNNDYTNFLEYNGFVLNKGKIDFYSDGLLFSTSTDFS